VEGEGTAFLSLTPFSRVTELALLLVVDPEAPFDPAPPIELLPAEPELPPAEPPPDPPPPPPPWPNAGADAAIIVAKVAAAKVVRIENLLNPDKATLSDTFQSGRALRFPHGSLTMASPV
jgi:hypothetical protein